jgi:hypothetical protein
MRCSVFAAELRLISPPPPPPPAALPQFEEGLHVSFVEERSDGAIEALSLRFSEFRAGAITSTASS